MTTPLPKPVKIIAALGPDGLIGLSGSLPPWKLEHDLPRFKRLTMGCPVVMGSATWKSLGRAKGLPGRLNVIVSRQSGSELGVAPGSEVTVVPTVGLALAAAQEWAAAREAASAVWIIGGAQLYGSFLNPEAPPCGPGSELHLTYVLPQPALVGLAAPSAGAPEVVPVCFPPWKDWGPAWRLSDAGYDGPPAAPEALYLVFKAAAPPLIQLKRASQLNNAAEALCESLEDGPCAGVLDQLVRDPACFWRGPWLLWSRTFSSEAEAYRSTP